MIVREALTEIARNVWSKMPPTTRSKGRMPDPGPLVQVPGPLGPPDASGRVPYICMHTICHRMATRSKRCSKTKEKAKTFSAAAVKVAKSREHVASLSWLVVVTEKYKDRMTESELRHLYIALGTGMGLVEQWMMERGFDPLGDYLKPN